MSSTSHYTELYAWLKPFLTQIKAKGFHVSLDTHIQIIKVLQYGAGKIEDEQVFLDYISPLLAKNKEDALLLQSEWIKYCERIAPPTQDPSQQSQKPKPPLYKILLGTAIGIALLILIGYWFIPPPPCETEAVYDVQSTDISQPVSFTALQVLCNSDDTSELKYVWDFGDGTIDSASGRVTTHIYDRAGSYVTSLLLRSRTPDIKITRDKEEKSFTLCKPALQISQSPDGDVSIAQEVAFSVSYDSLYPASTGNAWQVNGETVAQNKLMLTWSFDSAGTYEIAYIDSSYSGDCNASNSISVTVKPPTSIGVNINDAGELVVPPVKINNHVWWIIGLAFVISLLAYFSARRKLNALANENERNAANIISILNGKSEPYDAPYANHEEIIDDESLIPLLARQFRRRIADDYVSLNIPLTISSVVRSEGFLLPVYTAKTKPAEYLILIDNHHAKSGLVKLFEFLVKRFGKSDIYIDCFYFNNKPDRCYNSYYPRGIYTAQLYDLYPDHTVIIFGNGYQFIDRHYPAIDDTQALLFTKWKHKAIFTPVSYPDWSSKEYILQETFLLLPADLRGQLLLFDFIESPELDKADCLRQLKLTYKASSINFYSAAKIKRYLNDDFLFQWLCAVAISPSIHWQALLVIGDALQQHRYHDANIQYSSLLKLMRISWMSDAAFPEETRLELLKELEPENEKTAREAMISLTDEALQKIDQNSFVYEQLFMQQMTDKFLLYAYKPADPKYKNYKEDYSRFKTLWIGGKIRDTILKDYLKKEDGGQWSTLIGNEALSNTPTSSSSIDKIFADKPAAKATQIQWLKQSALIVAFVCVLVGILAFVLKNNLNGTPIDKGLNLTTVDENASVPFTFAIAYNQCYTAEQMQRDHTIFKLDFGGGNTLSLDGTDSAVQKNIPYALLKSKDVDLYVTSSNPQYNFVRVLSVNADRVSVSMTGCDMRCNKWTATGKQTIDSVLAGHWYSSDLLDGSKEIYEPTRIDIDNINTQVIEEVLVCSSNPQMQKIITHVGTEMSVSFQLYYILKTGPVYQIGFGQSSNSYVNNLEPAERDSSNPSLTDMISLAPSGSSYLKSNNFLKKVAGDWRNFDSTYTFGIRNGRIVLNSKYYLFSEEEVYNTAFGKPLYKFYLESEGIYGSSSFVYALILDSTRMLLSEMSGYNMSDRTPGTFRLLHKQTASGDIPGHLPESLNEIWHGGSSNQLININLTKNVLYYSKNDKEKIYDTSGFNEVSLTRSGVYKVITRTDRGYRLFLIRNVNPQSFELCVSQDLVKTKAELQNKDENDCDRFNTMNLHYENDATKIFYPVDYYTTLVPGQTAKLNALDKNYKYSITHYQCVRGPYSFPTSTLDKLGIKWVGEQSRLITNHSPFQRDYDIITKEGISKYSILWVDDHPENEVNRKAIAFFRQNNIGVDLAMTNAEAFKMLNSYAYAYIITDIGRNNGEPCVSDKDKAGVEFVQKLLNFNKTFVYVCAPQTTIELYKNALLNAGIPEGNLTCELQTVILKNIASGNNRIIRQNECRATKSPQYVPALCQKHLITTIKGVNVYKMDSVNIIAFTAKIAIDADGSPRAYCPDGKGIAPVTGAGQPGNWYVLTDSKGNPVLQKEGDPYPGCYISPTALSDRTKRKTDPTSYVNSEAIPYIVLPKSAIDAGAKIGDMAYVYNTKNKKACFAIVADIGSPNQLGEGSIYLANQLGINSNPRTGGTREGIIYLVFPGSGKGNGIVPTLPEIEATGKTRLDQYGGYKLIECLSE